MHTQLLNNVAKIHTEKFIMQFSFDISKTYTRMDLHVNSNR